MLNTFRSVTLAVLTFALLAALPSRAAALDRICDPAFENCRTPLIALINNETVGIDVAFWFMEDSRYSTAIIARWNAGVPVRVLMDTESSVGYPSRAATIQALRNAGIPMREKTGSGILHWKMMLFVEQNTVQFSGANYTGDAFVYNTPYSDYVDEVVYFTETQSIVDSFKIKFDDVWTTTSGYTDYANITGPLVRTYGDPSPTFSIDPEMNFPPYNSFRARSVTRYRAETTGIDAIIYRITDRAHSDEMIAAVARGVPVRLISEPLQYRDETRLWHSWNIDRMYMAGVQIKNRGHAGLTHEKLTLLRGQGMSVFGSSNWTSSSSSSQLEHNIFTVDPVFHTWAIDHFERKWNNTAPGGIVESAPFVPLPPNTPSLRLPANGAAEQPTSVTLTWWSGPWAHKYDVYMGTSPSSLAPILLDRELGPSEASTDYQTWNVTDLTAGTTYYWRVVAKTMANVSRTSVTFSFTTAGSAPLPPPPSPLPTPWASQDVGTPGTAGSAGHDNGTFTVSGSGPDIWGTADELHFAYQALAGDGTITARVASVAGSSGWAKAGVMIRESLGGNAREASIVVSPSNGVAFLARASTGGSTTYASGNGGAAPLWLRLTRNGNIISADRSSDGTTWTPVASQTISMAANVYIGLAVTSATATGLATATFSDVTIGAAAPPPPPPPPPTLPEGWSAGDIGTVGTAGSSDHGSGTFTVRGSGPDIWGGADELHFAHRTLDGDGSITARVASLSGTSGWAKAGVMIRESLSAGSREASLVVSPSNGIAFLARSATGGSTAYTNAGAGTAPLWLRLTRTGGSISAFHSADGVEWTPAGTVTLTLPAAIHIGLAVTSATSSGLATGTFTDVTVP